MHTDDIPARSLDMAGPSLFGVLRKFVPFPRRAVPRCAPCAELERLALSSPHLLPDLGFEADRAAAGPQQTVWRKGAYVVTICRAADPCGRPRVEARHAPEKA